MVTTSYNFFKLYMVISKVWSETFTVRELLRHLHYGSCETFTYWNEYYVDEYTVNLDAISQELELILAYEICTSTVDFGESDMILFESYFYKSYRDYFFGKCL